MPPGTDPRYAAVWRHLAEVLRRPGLAVLDAGGGSGGFAVPLAELGHRVTVVDPSPDALAALARRAGERGVADRVTGRQGDLLGLVDVVGAGVGDLLLCHAVLDRVDDPARALTAAVEALRPAGWLSLLVAGRAGAVVARASAGRFDDAERALGDPAGRCGEHDVRRFDLDEVTALAHAAGTTVVAAHGVGVFPEPPGGSAGDQDPTRAGRLAALEAAVAARPPYRDLATHLHVLARNRDGSA